MEKNHNCYTNSCTDAQVERRFRVRRPLTPLFIFSLLPADWRLCSLAVHHDCAQMAVSASELIFQIGFSAN